MKIKNEEELANILSMAFKTYSNKVERGLVQPFLNLIEGAESVDVTVTLLADGSITVQKTMPKETPQPLEQSIIPEVPKVASDELDSPFETATEPKEESETENLYTSST